MRTHSKSGKWGQKAKTWAADGKREENAIARRNKNVENHEAHTVVHAAQLRVFRLWGRRDREVPHGPRLGIHCDHLHRH